MRHQRKMPVALQLHCGSEIIAFVPAFVAHQYDTDHNACNLLRWIFAEQIHKQHRALIDNSTAIVSFTTRSSTSPLVCERDIACRPC